MPVAYDPRMLDVLGYRDMELRPAVRRRLQREEKIDWPTPSPCPLEGDGAAAARAAALEQLLLTLDMGNIERVLGHHATGSYPVEGPFDACKPTDSEIFSEGTSVGLRRGARRQTMVAGISKGHWGHCRLC